MSPARASRVARRLAGQRRRRAQPVDRLQLAVEDLHRRRERVHDEALAARGGRHGDAGRRGRLERAERLARELRVARGAERARGPGQRLDGRGLRHAADPRRRALGVAVEVLPRAEAAALGGEPRGAVDLAPQRAAAAAGAGPVEAAVQAGVDPAPGRERVQLHALSRHVLEHRRGAAERAPLAGGRERRLGPGPGVAAQVEEHGGEPARGQGEPVGERLDRAEHRTLLDAARAGEPRGGAAGPVVGGAVAAVRAAADRAGEPRAAERGADAGDAAQAAQRGVPARGGGRDRPCGLGAVEVDGVPRDRLARVDGDDAPRTLVRAPAAPRDQQQGEPCDQHRAPSRTCSHRPER